MLVRPRIRSPSPLLDVDTRETVNVRLTYFNKRKTRPFPRNISNFEIIRNRIAHYFPQLRDDTEKKNDEKEIEENDTNVEEDIDIMVNETKNSGENSKNDNNNEPITDMNDCERWLYSSETDGQNWHIEYNGNWIETIDDWNSMILEYLTIDYRNEFFLNLVIINDKLQSNIQFIPKAILFNPNLHKIKIERKELCGSIKTDPPSSNLTNNIATASIAPHGPKWHVATPNMMPPGIAHGIAPPPFGWPPNQAPPHGVPPGVMPPGFGNGIAPPFYHHHAPPPYGPPNMAPPPHHINAHFGNMAAAPPPMHGPPPGHHGPYPMPFGMHPGAPPPSQPHQQHHHQPLQHQHHQQQHQQQANSAKSNGNVNEWSNSVYNHFTKEKNNTIDEIDNVAEMARIAKLETDNDNTASPKRPSESAGAHTTASIKNENNDNNNVNNNNNNNSNSNNSNENENINMNIKEETQRNEIEMNGNRNGNEEHRLRSLTPPNVRKGDNSTPYQSSRFRNGNRGGNGSGRRNPDRYGSHGSHGSPGLGPNETAPHVVKPDPIHYRPFPSAGQSTPQLRKLHKMIWVLQYQKVGSYISSHDIRVCMPGKKKPTIAEIDEFLDYYVGCQWLLKQESNGQKLWTINTAKKMEAFDATFWTWTPT